ncbi:lipoprotein-releasing system ATP-binding protein LolD [Streptomyces glebosus]|uniref:Lipoprotein-releasing system ATP-binding protein LolD n=1 Tax=Streptomyces glebosus TaxID=249580 RepID=A0A640T0E0_9ACTN|nr:lipoprotein-releasing system ATP-binding protein LolD [Streptomyces glebosus]GHG67221.1 lipoprotein-releasing system ATP-binding protein LolD [Streptomyces glebosus]
MGQVKGETGGGGPVLKVSGLRYEVADRVLLDGVNLQVCAGESAAVVGPSGSGKSTLLGCVLGLIRPAQGKVEVAGQDVARMRQRALERHRSRHMGVVFQFGELLPELTPVENVALAALLGGTPSNNAYERAEALLRDLGVPYDRAPTGQLSGGERQRTAVARALINQPALLLADEPTGALDRATRDSVTELLFDVPKRWGCALVVVTHDFEVADRADRCLELTAAALVPRKAGDRS